MSHRVFWKKQEAHGRKTEWPVLQRRVLENQEPLRQVASDYGVSHETVRRVLLACRKKDIG